MGRYDYKVFKETEEKHNKYSDRYARYANLFDGKEASKLYVADKVREAIKTDMEYSAYKYRPKRPEGVSYTEWCVNDEYRVEEHKPYLFSDKVRKAMEKGVGIEAFKDALRDEVWFGDKMLKDSIESVGIWEQKLYELYEETKGHPFKRMSRQFKTEWKNLADECEKAYEEGTQLTYTQEACDFTLAMAEKNGGIPQFAQDIYREDFAYKYERVIPISFGKGDTFVQTKEPSQKCLSPVEKIRQAKEEKLMICSLAPSVKVKGEER